MEEEQDEGAGSSKLRMEADVARWVKQLDELDEESDRGAFLVATSRIEVALGALIEAGLRPCPTSNDDLLDGPNAPLGTLSSRIAMAHRLGLIDDDLAWMLNQIRRTRNTLAHQAGKLSFTEGQTGDRVRTMLARFEHVPGWDSLVANLVLRHVGVSAELRTLLSYVVFQLEDDLSTVERPESELAIKLLDNDFFDDIREVADVRGMARDAVGRAPRGE